MKTRKEKIKAEGLLTRKPWQRLEDGARQKVIRDVTRGHMSYGEASRRYNLSRNTIKKWVSDESITRLLKSKTTVSSYPLPSGMTEDAQNKLLRQQIKTLTQQLEQAKLKAQAFETMIIVAEEELKIKIRKKRGENAMAERVNDIIKNDFFPKIIYQNHQQAQRAIQKVITIYNENRPHLSLDYMTPGQAHEYGGNIKKRWKQYCKKTKQKEVIMNKDP